MLHAIGLVLAWIGVVGIVGIGTAYLAKNEHNASGFGLPIWPPPDARGWWQVKGIRDVTSGVVIAVIVFAAPAALGWLLLAAAITPAGDAVIVLTNRGNRTAALAVHGATAAGLVLAAALLLVSR